MKVTVALDKAKYAALLGEYTPRPIHTEKDSRRAIALLEAIHENEPLTPEQEAVAELLTTLIEKFEEERYALTAASPASILGELLQANGLEQKDLAQLVGSKGVASELLSGKRRISRSQAHLFADRFSVP
jgi:HTH-type transcriptional regulator / antitoxin HigA